MTWLLDGNLLVALVLDSHIHHERAHRWFSKLKKESFATCATTQGTLLRMHMKFAAQHDSESAWSAIRQVATHPLHVWWGDDLSYLDVPHRNLQGGAQVTDAWLAELTRRNKGRLATLDSGLAALHADVAELIPL